MQCARCGLARPGLAAACPDCGQRFALGSIEAPRPPELSGGFFRVLVYALLLFGAVRLLSGLYAQYLDAEKDRVEAALLGQSLERRKALQDASAQ